MSAATLDRETYDLTVNEHTYSVRFSGIHAHIVHGASEIPLVLYLKQYVPQSLHVEFFRRIMYIAKEFRV